MKNSVILPCFFYGLPDLFNRTSLILAQHTFVVVHDVAIKVGLDVHSRQHGRKDGVRRFHVAVACVHADDDKVIVDSHRFPPHVSVSTRQARACHRRSHSIVVSRAAGQLQIDGPLLHDLPGNAVEHRKPGFVGALGDAQLVAGFLRDKGLVINGILSVHGLHLGSGLVC